MLPEKIAGLKKRLIEYVALVEDMIDKSVKGLLNKNEALLREIIIEEERANQYDNEIDETCTALIAQFEPVAKDLRTVIMILKMNKDLERIADHAVNIAESSLYLTAHPTPKCSQDIEIMAKTAAGMLRDSIRAFVNEDAGLAQTVRKQDAIVDKAGDKILEDLTEFMKKEHDDIKQSLHLMRIAYNLERIADLSTNICEEVIYIVEGRDVRHHKNKQGNGNTGKDKIW